MTMWMNAFALAAALQAGDKPLTLDEALIAAEKASYSVQVAESAVEKARQRANEAAGNMGPRVSVGATYSRFDAKSFGQGGGPGAIDSKNANATVSMPLDVVGVLGRLKRASNQQVLAAERQLAATRNDLRLNVRRAYYNALRAGANVAVFEASLTSANERLSKAEASLKQDSIAPVDVLRFRTQVRSAEGDLVVAKNTLRLAEQGLNLALSRPIETPVALVEIDKAPQVGQADAVLVGFGQKSRPEVQSLEANLTVLREITEAQRGGLLPSLGVQVSHQRFIDSVGPTGKDNQTTATLSVSFPVFDSGITKSKIRQSREDEKQVQLQLDQLRLAISQEVRAALRSLASAQERRDTAEKQVTLAAEVLRIANVRADAGEGTTLEVVDAQTQLTLARTSLVAARYDYLISYSELLRAIGTDDPNAVPTAGAKP